MCIKYTKDFNLFISSGEVQHASTGNPSSSGTYDITEKEGKQCGGHQSHGQWWPTCQHKQNQAQRLYAWPKTTQNTVKPCQGVFENCKKI
jgi:hypothetical protein